MVFPWIFFAGQRSQRHAVLSLSLETGDEHLAARYDPCRVTPSRGGPGRETTLERVGLMLNVKSQKDPEAQILYDRATYSWPVTDFHDWADAVYAMGGSDGRWRAVAENNTEASTLVFGGAHPTVSGMEHNLRNARAKLAAREGDVESVREAVEAMAPGDA